MHQRLRALINALTRIAATNRAGYGSAPLALGLQGGGALGSFTAGVLDALLARPDFRFSAVSGASAGAINAALLISGWLRSGPDGARQDLLEFWRRISTVPAPPQYPALAIWLNQWRDRWAFHSSAPGLLPVSVSPYEFNPFNHNPLRNILGELVDFELIRRPDAPRIFVSATSVASGKPRVFDNANITLESLLASACLPQLFHAVEIDGAHYWDGGYTANPPLSPLRAYARRGRVLLVLLNATTERRLPRTARNIVTRLNQIIGNAHLLHELKEFGSYEKIELADYLRIDSPASKLNNDWHFVQRLRDLGIAAAKDWLSRRARPRAVPKLVHSLMPGD